MSTKLKNLIVNPEFQDLFAFRSKDEERRHAAQMISYRILSEVERACEEKEINKKQLASMVGASASYITQLFRGSKQVNMDVMGRFEEALELSFVINVRFDTESQQEFVFNQVDSLGLKSCKHKQKYWNSVEVMSEPGCDHKNETTTRFLFELYSNSSNTQKAS